MYSIPSLNIRTVNLIAALIIGLFVIFPEIMESYEHSASGPPAFERSRSGPPEFRNSKMAPPPDVDKDFMKDENRFGVQHVFEKTSFNFLFFFLLSISLLYFNTRELLYKRYYSENDRRSFVTILLGSIAICLIFSVIHYFINSRLFFQAHGMNIFRYLFVLIICVLFGYVMNLIYRQHDMAIENEHLKSENLQNRYNALTSQINPHFFFNSLNTLASLVRDGESVDSLKYINQMSDIFRYVLKNNRQEFVQLCDEMHFLEAYRYMLQIRYKNKLFFDIKVDNCFFSYFLPALSFQPVIENAVKHNVISDDRPLTIQVYIENDEMLVVSNFIQQKLNKESSTGIGLENLNKRYILLTSKNIVVEDDAVEFVVKLPITAKLPEK
jgi:two-component system, LytTR family, sensor kinase